MLLCLAQIGTNEGTDCDDRSQNFINPSDSSIPSLFEEGKNQTFTQVKNFKAK